ncbi:uncharacterized protein B0J16DRAFT_333422 [Fusarium flagelliforme]|uniref:Mtf2-like C-terminal domain-containing protein n=1 Tax=Fusarium flagelliforme TaxID=2675880 RepID=A0A395MXJ6_9HYPO|nr:uncharacterized protein B0J16DRAFT_333422 [Fusarium flagelliforme]KAH7192625.1 hypothetical protein B0J16DRAFT_333422 [Fusarium flagelliforme]RFN52467.1 hypothetical protein FIE12Z_3228 [Fusarium flagelliforme]
MSRNLLPFLYQTRTLQLACRRPASILFTQKAGVATTSCRPRRFDNSIPFEFDEDELESSGKPLVEEQGEEDAGPDGTLTPTETEIFKSIFDDISHARLRQTKKPAQTGDAQPTPKPTESDLVKENMGNTLVEKARGANMEYLKKYPASLRKAAENALGKFESAPKRPKLYNLAELDKEEKAQARKWKEYEQRKEKEHERISKLMRDCKTDVELWDVMEREVFSLPEKLGIVEVPKTETRGRKPKNAPAAQKTKKSKSKEEINDTSIIMDVHGHLYPQLLSYGLDLLDSAFEKPSMLAFDVFPRIKELGLSSYVLGVSTPLFLKLADIHWKRYGDGVTAFDTLDEMKPLGIFPTQPDKLLEVEELVNRISDHLHGCTWGAQGPFVMAMMQGPPFDATLMARIGHMKGMIAKKQFRNERDARNLARDEEVKSQYQEAVQ